jgi:hypothetical protein
MQLEDMCAILSEQKLIQWVNQEVRVRTLSLRMSHQCHDTLSYDSTRLLYMYCYQNYSEFDSSK